MKIAVFINFCRDNDSPEIREEVEKIALSTGFEIDNENPDIVFACGGDGTLLRAIHTYINKLDKVSFCGVNFGHLGFFYDYEKDEFDTALKEILDGKMRPTKHKLICGEIENVDGVISKVYAVNEIRVENNLKPLIASVYVDEELFENFLGTGLTISSSVGSTAYNLTLGGAAVSCEVETLQITPIQPSTQCKCFKGSVILPAEKKIFIDGLLNNVLLGYDYVVEEKQSFKSITISSSNKEFTLLNRSGTHSLSKLRKLYN